MTNERQLPETGGPGADRASQVLANHPRREPAQVTVGAGIAIAGTWIGGCAVTITILITTVLDPMTDAEWAEVDGWAALVILLLISSPMIASYFLVKMILSKD